MLEEQLIRDAYDAIAETAPVPERVRAGISARRRVHRQRRAVLAGAGAFGAVAAAAAVGVPLATRDRRTGWTAAPPSPAPAPSAVFAAVEVPLRFAPGWLPDGVGEQYRRVVTGPSGGATRSWMPTGMQYPTDFTGPKGVTFAIDERIDDNSGTPVQIGSVTGRLRVTDAVYLEWQPPGAPNLLLTVYALPNAQATALRVARSVAASTATTQLSMRAGWVPERFTGYTVTDTYPAGNGWRQVVTHSSADHRQACAIVAQTAPAPADSAHRILRPDGVTLYVPGASIAAVGEQPLTAQEAARLLDEVAYTAPDLSWVGGR